ncbi:winged helix-turn-helix transcriptional regulator [Aestuariibius sp. 2305UL40-4]|uniref:winged helix-turn-helix transcriptional regulator n=1 Tax=Aestuariibius violaceus TaxID=3234132 RepID=UPI00345EC597
MDTKERICQTETCPVTRTVQVMGGRWKPIVLYYLAGRPRRFNELRRLIPEVTQRMLTQHLRQLEADGVVHRDVKAQVPPHVEYSLTEMGRSLMPILEGMAEWGEAHPGSEAARRAS